MDASRCIKAITNKKFANLLMPPFAALTTKALKEYPFTLCFLKKRSHSAPETAAVKMAIHIENHSALVFLKGAEVKIKTAHEQ